MSYRLNGPSSKQEAECHFDNVRLGMKTSRAIRYLFKIEDLKGKLPKERNEAYDRFVEIFRQEKQSGLFAGLREFSQYTLYELLEDSVEGLRSSSDVHELLESILNPSLNEEKRLKNVRRAIVFFRVLNKKCLVNSEYPDTSIPQGVLEITKV